MSKKCNWCYNEIKGIIFRVPQETPPKYFCSKEHAKYYFGYERGKLVLNKNMIDIFAEKDKWNKDKWNVCGKLFESKEEAEKYRDRIFCCFESWRKYKSQLENGIKLKDVNDIIEFRQNLVFFK